MYRILVPFDGSARAERAIPWADELAGALGAEVELLRVVGPNDFPDEAFSDLIAYQIVENESSAGLATVEMGAEQFARVTPMTRQVMGGEAGATIAARAHSIGADLIVMSSHGRSDLQRALLGSVADEVIRESRVPVLVIRDGVPSSPSRMPRKVLVPLDGSELSEAILSYLTPLAQTLGWSLALFWQVDLPPLTIPIQGALVPLGFAADEGRADMIEYLERVTAQLQAKGITAEPRVWFGSRAQSIVEYANTEHMDLIAMSTHGRNGLGRWLRGSVTQYVLEHAAVPVMTVRPASVPMSSSLGARLSGEDKTEGAALTSAWNGLSARRTAHALRPITSVRGSRWP